MCERLGGVRYEDLNLPASPRDSAGLTEFMHPEAEPIRLVSTPCSCAPAATHWRARQRRSRFGVPPTLTASISKADAVKLYSAATCTTASQPRTARSSATRSRTSTHSGRTSRPARTSAQTRWQPMNPRPTGHEDPHEAIWHPTETLNAIAAAVPGSRDPDLRNQAPLCYSRARVKPVEHLGSPRPGLAHSVPSELSSPASRSSS
jgi:hypothetical protein